MERILFTKTGILCSMWDHKLAKWNEVDLTESQIPFSWCLPYSVEVDEGVTILEILNNLKSQWDHVNYVFVNPMMGIRMEDLLTAVTSANKKERSSVNAVCLNWAAEMRNDEDRGMSMYPTILGVVMNDDDEDEFHDLYDLSISDLLNQPLVVDDWLEVVDSEDQLGDPVFDGAFAWSLYDFLNGILSELTLFAYSYGIVSLPEGVQTSPISITDLMNHIDDIDKMIIDEGGL